MKLELMKEMIYKRRSVRRYKAGKISPEDKEIVCDLIDELVPLYPEIKTHIEIISRRHIHTTMLWAPEEVIVFYSEPKAGYLTNAGFMLGELDLALQAMGIGTCYIGLARMGSYANHCVGGGLEYVMTLAIGYTDVPPRNGEESFMRKPLSDITDTADSRLSPMRLAASSMNTQSWFVRGEEDVFYLYRRQISRSRDIERMNRFDVGIALSHLYVSYPDTFEILCDTPVPVINNHDSILAFRI